MNVYTPLSFFLIVFIVAVALIAVVYYFLKMRNSSGPDTRKSMQRSKEPGEEKRQQPRADINWSASIETPEGTLKTEIKNISLLGAFICCKKPLPVGEVFRVTMIGPDKEPVVATAKVVWSNVNVPEDKVVNRGMGVRFINMSDKHIQLVKRILEERT